MITSLRKKKTWGVCCEKLRGRSFHQIFLEELIAEAYSPPGWSPEVSNGVKKELSLTAEEGNLVIIVKRSSRREKASGQSPVEILILGGGRRTRLH